MLKSDSIIASNDSVQARFPTAKMKKVGPNKVVWTLDYKEVAFLEEVGGVERFSLKGKPKT